VASDATAFRVIDRIASDPALLRALRAARARARENAWNAAGAAPARIVVVIDATLITSHSDKDGAAGTFNGGFGFHPLLAYLDETREPLAGVLRPGNAGANTAADHIEIVDLALEQLPRAVVETAQILVRTDSAAATHEPCHISGGTTATEPPSQRRSSSPTAITSEPETTRMIGQHRDGAATHARPARHAGEPRSVHASHHGTRDDAFKSFPINLARRPAAGPSSRASVC